MRPNVASVPVTMDQEDVANIMRKHKYLAMPVVDPRNRLIGLITVDDMVDVLQEEATEDVQKMFGAGAEERLGSPWQFSFRKRVGWLEVNLATAFLAAWGGVPVRRRDRGDPGAGRVPGHRVGHGRERGGRSPLAVAIRGIALGENGPGLLARALYRELVCALLTGVAVGLPTWACAALGIFGHSQYGQHPVKLGAIMCLALVLNHVNACVTGVSIPFFMKKLGFDPAQSATIFATTFTRLRRVLRYAVAGESVFASTLIACRGDARQRRGLDPK